MTWGTDEFADLRSSRGAGFDRRSHTSYIAGHHGGGYERATDVDAFDDLDAGGLGHGVGRFDQCKRPLVSMSPIAVCIILIQ